MIIIKIVLSRILYVYFFFNQTIKTFNDVYTVFFTVKNIKLKSITTEN